MQTQCPNCATVFKVTDKQLSVAESKVRCSKCDSIFDGRQYIVDQKEKSNESILNEVSIRDIKRHIRGNKNIPAWRISIWVLFCLSFIGLLFSQFIWINRASLVEHQKFGQSIRQTCTYLDFCEIPEKRDIRAFSLASRQIFSHPNIENALILSASFSNDAEFAQSFPLILVSMSNKQGEVIAERYFEPKVYSEDFLADTKVLPKQTVNLSLALADPGDAAIAFEIDFY